MLKRRYEIQSLLSPLYHWLSKRLRHFGATFRNCWGSAQVNGLHTKVITKSVSRRRRQSYTKSAWVGDSNEGSSWFEVLSRSSKNG